VPHLSFILMRNVIIPTIGDKYFHWDTVHTHTQMADVCVRVCVCVCVCVVQWSKAHFLLIED
jgi:hypothetical protein